MPVLRVLPTFPKSRQRHDVPIAPCEGKGLFVDYPGFAPAEWTTTNPNEAQILDSFAEFAGQMDQLPRLMVPVIDGGFHFVENQTLNNICKRL